MEDELVETRVEVGGRTLAILHPPDAAALIDEEAFARDEFLPYWAELWPSGIALARIAARLVGAGERVLELGCGLALPSIAAALAGARVVASDWSAEALELAARNAARNGASLETAHTGWAEAEELVDRGPWDWVLASDVLYERRNVPLLEALLPRLVDRTGSILLADPGRPQARSLVEGGGPWAVEQLPGDPQSPRVTVVSLRRR